MSKIFIWFMLTASIPVIVVVQSCDEVQDINEFGKFVAFEKDKCILFPEVRIRYVGDILEKPHEKITSQVFEIEYSGEKKIKKSVLAMSLYDKVIRFGMRTFILEVNRSKKTLTLTEGNLWALIVSFF